MSSDFSLTLRDLRPTDTSRYICTVYSSGGGVARDEASLTVLSKIACCIVHSVLQEPQSANYIGFSSSYFIVSC